MAHTLYLRDFSSNAGGTLPSGEQSALTADYTAASGSTFKRLGINPGLPMSMVGYSGNSLAALTPQSGLYGMFIANRFGENSDISIQTLTVNIAMQESDANMNMGVGLTANVYVWRPSTGALVGIVCANVPLTGAIEPTAGSVRVVQGTATTTLVSTLFADVLICEVWQTHTQGAATSFTGGLYYNGSVVTTVNNTLVTDHASFINFSFDNLPIEVGFANGDLNVTLGAATLSSTGTVQNPPITGTSNGQTASGGGGYARPQTAPKPSGKPSSNRDFKKLLDGIFEPKEEETLAEAIEEIVQPQKETILLPLPDKNLELLLKSVILKPVKKEEPMDPIILLLANLI